MGIELGLGDADLGALGGRLALRPPDVGPAAQQVGRDTSDYLNGRRIGRLATVSTRATSAISYRGHVVWVQRRNAFGRWVALRRVVLRSNSLPTLATVRLPHGLSRLRVTMTAVQAGIGYTAGTSRTMLVLVR